MVRVLTDAELDPIADSVDATLSNEEEAAELRRFAPTERVGDLTDGGMVNGARLRPMAGGKTLPRGRAAARRAWMWNGTESMLPLAWNPDGNMHDGAKRYLLKRHCLCCHTGGFRGRQCPNCVKSNCEHCKASTDPTKVIPNFYLRKEDVPFPTRFYGDVNCFLEFCTRRDSKGFKTEQDMRVHARTRHRLEYQAHVETLAAAKADEVDTLRRRVDELLSRPSTAPTTAVQAGTQSASKRWTPERRKAASVAAKKRAAGGVAR